MSDTSPGTWSRAKGVEVSLNVVQSLLLLWFIRLPGQSVCRSVLGTRNQKSVLGLTGIQVLHSPKILEVLVVCQYKEWVLCSLEPFFQGRLHC